MTSDTKKTKNPADSAEISSNDPQLEEGELSKDDLENIAGGRMGKSGIRYNTFRR